MGVAVALTMGMFAGMRRSDLEMQLSMILMRKLAVLDKCNEISSHLANAMFQSDNNGNINGAAAVPRFIPASSGFIPGLPTMAVDPYGTYVYEQELGQLQTIEKQLDTQQKKIEIELESVKAMEESFMKMAKENAKRDFTIGA